MHAMATAAVKQLQKRLKSLSSTEPYILPSPALRKASVNVRKTSPSKVNE